VENVLTGEVDCLPSIPAQQPYRCTVFRINLGNHVIALSILCTTLKSCAIDDILSDLALLYTSAVGGEQHSCHFSSSQTLHNGGLKRTNRSKSEDQKTRQDWTAILKGGKAAEMPFDKRRPSMLSGRMQVQNFTLSGQDNDRIESFGRVNNMARQAILLSAFGALHHRLTNSTDATLALLTKKQDSQYFEHALWTLEGIQYMNLHVEQESFTELTAQVTETLRSTMSYQSTTLNDINAALRREQSRPKASPVQVLFAFSHEQTPKLRTLPFAGLEVTVLDRKTESPYDLEFRCYEGQGSINVSVWYSEDLYSYKTVSNLISVFCNVLASCLRSPSDPIVSLLMFEDKDYENLEEMDLIRISDPSYQRNNSIVDVFQQKARQFPEAIAVKDASALMTYCEMDNTSDRLALWLLEQSMPPESLVGVFSDRSCETVVVFLGVLKAGLAYLPLDVKTPPVRLRTILGAISKPFLILQGSNACIPKSTLSNAKISKLKEAFLHDLKGGYEGKRRLKMSAPMANSLAYVMFTSGSTGKPKGVMIEHRGVVRLAKNKKLLSHVPDVPIVAHMSNIAFDAATWDIYAALLNGGTVVCVDDMTISDAASLSELFHREKINHVFLTAALFRLYVAENLAAFSKVDSVFVGGDKTDLKSALDFRAASNATLANVYGPTENTTFSTLYSFGDLSVEQRFNSLPIGRAISHSGAYVVDACLQLVPLGVNGELVLTGDGLAPAIPSVLSGLLLGNALYAAI
jgi:non-ribosomal peptide synthetase component F